MCPNKNTSELYALVESLIPMNCGLANWKFDINNKIKNKVTIPTQEEYKKVVIQYFKLHIKNKKEIKSVAEKVLKELEDGINPALEKIIKDEFLKYSNS